MKCILPFFGALLLFHLPAIAQDLAKQATTHAQKTAASLRRSSDVEPEFPGGYDSMARFIQYHFEYPERAIEKNIEGQVIVEFVVGTNGEISNVRMNQSLVNCRECNEAAMNVVRKFPRWSPAKVNGKTVESTFNLPITLELEVDEAEVDD